MPLSKRLFKICEAVRLGLEYYYIGSKDKRKLTAADRAEAEKELPTLPDGWWRAKLPWMLHQ